MANIERRVLSGNGHPRIEKKILPRIKGTDLFIEIFFR